MDIKDLELLLDEFKKVNIGYFPTPIQRIKNFEDATHLKNLYIKRDDLNENPGGNKIRHLEYLLGDAINNGYDSFIISGPIQSNFCVATALACTRVNFPCYVLHNCDKPSELLGNNLLNNLMGANQLFLGEMSFPDLEKEVFKLGDKLKNEGKNPYVFHTKRTKAIAALGYVECVLEIYKQCKNEGLNIKDIFVPVGNGIFAAGVVYGNLLLEMPFNVGLVSVEFEKNEAEAKIKELIHDLVDLTDIKANNLDEIVYVYDEYNGGGWGIPTDESIDIIKKLASTEGIFLEKTYTSKGFYGMVDLLQKGVIKSESSCYINSGGFPSLFTQFK